MDECWRIWNLSGFQGIPPDPYEVVYLSEARKQVVTLAEIYRFQADEEKRKGLGAT